ncbi:MAG: LLM class flavin-dependent oxidoreductase [Dehalococcoidia bacterium]|nr:LLM class flavin-dependent oxidoreductase [Dehalococcoidia bacterium]
MHFGLVMECDYREGATQVEAFQEAFDQVDAGEDLGLDGVWLAERHFAAPRSRLDPMGVGVPSIVSAPLIMASAIAARTKRLRVGMAVSVLPLNHPVRMAEEAATVDNVAQGRFDFGVGRSGFARAYQGYGIPYEESRARFQECLDVIIRAWTNDRFSYDGRYYKYDNVCVLPKPYQQPHPPIRVAATTADTFPRVGALGQNVFVGLRGMDRPELADHISRYREAWREAGHPGEGDVLLRMPVYVAETDEGAVSESEESTMGSYRRLAENFVRTATEAGASKERAERGRRLANITYEDLLRDRVAYGGPESVADRIGEITEELNLSGVIAEMNVGGQIPRERVLNSLRLFCQRVIPRLR